MNKSTLKAEFVNAKIKDAKYIGVSIKTEGSSQPGSAPKCSANCVKAFTNLWGDS